MSDSSDTTKSESAASLVRVQVDEALCIGSGQCENLEPETLYLDDETVIAKVIGTGELPRERAQTVVDMCPVGAISIVAT